MGSERQRLETWEERIAIFNRDRGKCRYCGKSIAMDSFEVAHVIMDSKWTRKAYGDSVIDHPLNKAATCKKDRCNSGMLITFNRSKAEEHAEKIRDEMMGE
jgi:hypothetical protein